MTRRALFAVFGMPFVLRRQHPTEGAMGRVGDPSEYPVRMSGQAQEFFYRVVKEQTFDFKGIQFFRLKSSEGTATISVDGDVHLSAALAALDGQRVRLTLEPATLTLRKVGR
jgi:hypothetical protein